MVRILSLLFIIIQISLFSQSIVINEFCTKNDNVLSDGDFNQFSDWIELYNPESTLMNISGFFLTDDTLQKTKWQFPPNSIIGANEYLILWADNQDTIANEYHTNFRLNSNNEWIALFDADTNLIDAIEYFDQMDDISFGRTSNAYAYFFPATPGEANNTTAFPSAERENPPSFSLPSGFYIANTQLEISNILLGDTIRYTTDGSFPDEQASIYTEPIILSENLTVRARTFGNILPSEETSCTYFIGINKQLPIVSLIIDPAFLWSDSIGIFNDIEIEKRVLWERSSKIQYFESNDLKFETNNNIRLFGSTAYELPQKSFAVFANSQIQYEIFEGKDLSVFDSFIMRSSSDDWNQTMFRDGFVQSIIPQKLKIDYQAYQPTVLYINGEYFGLFNLREKYNEDYLKNIHGVDKDSIDLLKLNYWGLDVEVLSGTDEEYFEMLNYLNTNDMTDDAVFDGISDYLDIVNYTNYIIAHIYTGNISYKHNIKTWRKNNVVDGFKWLLFDMDRAYKVSGYQIFNMIHQADPVFKKLLENTNYRNHFLQQTCSHINVTFRKDFIYNLIDSLKLNIEPEMLSHIENWAPYGGVQSIEEWYSAIKVMTDFSDERKDTLLYRLDSVYGLSGQVNVLLKKNYPRGGEIYFEDIQIPYNDSIHTYFKDIPVKLVAKPHLGYHFIDWENVSNEDSIIYTFSTDETINVRFEADCEIPDIISEDAMLVKDCSPYHFQNNITIESGATLFCEPGVEIFFAENAGILGSGNLKFVGTESEPITIRGEEDVYWKYIESNNGNIHFENVELFSGEKAISFVSEGNLKLENCIFYESDMNISDLISCEAATVVINNNVFYGNQANTKKDCIDCGSLLSGEFKENTFYDFTDDCIDIGNNSSDIFISQNQAYNCESMGISIGEDTEAYIHKNIIAHCKGGIQVHTDALATIINNTLFENEVGIKCYHYDDPANSGGTAIVINTIISQCYEDYTLQSNSQINFSYSLSDNELHPGVGNLTGDPMFVNSMDDNFQLLEGSPCINAGDILSPPEPDGTRVDIGALRFNNSSYIPEIEGYFSIFPNPFSNNFTVLLDSTSKIDDIIIYNLLGELIYSQSNVNSISHAVEISSKGLLLILVSDTNGNKSVMKLISK